MYFDNLNILKNLISKCTLYNYSYITHILCLLICVNLFVFTYLYITQCLLTYMLLIYCVYTFNQRFNISFAINVIPLLLMLNVINKKYKFCAMIKIYVLYKEDNKRKKEKELDNIERYVIMRAA